MFCEPSSALAKSPLASVANGDAAILKCADDEPRRETQKRDRNTEKRIGVLEPGRVPVEDYESQNDSRDECRYMQRIERNAYPEGSPEDDGKRG